MDKFHAFMMRYTLGVGRLLQAYCKWAEGQAKNQLDLLLLGLGPIFALGLLLWALPAWIGKPIAFVLSLPALYIIFLVLRAYASRGGKPKAELTDAERQQAQTGKDMAKRAKDLAKVSRRIGLK